MSIKDLVHKLRTTEGETVEGNLPVLKADDVPKITKDSYDYIMEELKQLNRVSDAHKADKLITWNLFKIWVIDTISQYVRIEPAQKRTLLLFGSVDLSSSNEYTTRFISIFINALGTYFSEKAISRFERNIHTIASHNKEWTILPVGKAMIFQAHAISMFKELESSELKTFVKNTLLLCPGIQGILNSLLVNAKVNDVLLFCAKHDGSHTILNMSPTLLLNHIEAFNFSQNGNQKDFIGDISNKNNGSKKHYKKYKKRPTT